MAQSKVTKASILTEIRRTAEENGGVALGKAKFFDATGIRESDWLGRWWTKWSDAVREAGLEPRSMNPRLGDEAVLEAAASMVRRIGRFPTAAEIRLECSDNPGLPSHNTFRRFGGLPGLRSRLREYASERHLVDLIQILGVTADAVVTGKPAEEGFVYLIKSGRHFKIGKANSVDARYRQLKIQLPQAAEIVHRIKTDDPFGIEQYWHRRFAEKRLNGEWFELSADDVKSFRRRRFM